MYKTAYGIIETLAPLHVGATAGEERGNLNLIFRDQFTQTGIIPGSSIRGRLRSQIRQVDSEATASYWYGHEAESELSENTTESLVKFEYASILWLPVFCPGQPIVWVSCPKLLKRYKRMTGNSAALPDPNQLKYKGSNTLTRISHERRDCE
ncbi:MAG: RAMP superfamily CRISPR-associated protein [Coleofasciculus sp. E2-BRE-01]